MSHLIEKAMQHQISRRTFLGVAAVTAAAATLPAVGLQKVSKAEAAAQSEGEWVTAACWHNCGGRCLNKVLVADGVVVRQKSDDTHPDSPDFPQQRSCVRGHSQRKQILGADRLKYPMKRKNWAPGGGKKELRGKDEWVRISWDEALDIVASEIKRMKDKYGNQALFVADSTEISRALALFGGYSERWGAVSWGRLAGSLSVRYGHCRQRLQLRQRPVPPAQVQADHSLGRQPRLDQRRHAGLQPDAGQESWRQDHRRGPALHRDGPGSGRRVDSHPPRHRHGDAARHGPPHDHRRPARPGVPGQVLRRL
jgi:hypothetical protein